MTNSWKKRLFAILVAFSMVMGDIPAPLLESGGQVYAETDQAVTQPAESDQGAQPAGLEPDAQPAGQDPVSEAGAASEAAAQEGAASSEETAAVLSASQGDTENQQVQAQPANQPAEVQQVPDQTVTEPEEVQQVPEQTVTEPEEVQQVPEQTVTEPVEVQPVPDQTVTEPEEVQTVQDQTVTEPAEPVQGVQQPENPTESEKETEVGSENQGSGSDQQKEQAQPQGNEGGSNLLAETKPAADGEQQSDAAADGGNLNPEAGSAGTEAGTESNTGNDAQGQDSASGNSEQQPGNEAGDLPQAGGSGDQPQAGGGESEGGNNTQSGGEGVPGLPEIPVDAEIRVGEEKKVQVTDVGAMVRLKVTKSDTLIMTATGMEAWVDLVREGEKKGERFMPENGELNVRFTVTPGSYMMTFAAVKTGQEGELTIRVRTEEEVLAELLGGAAEGGEAGTGDAAGAAGSDGGAGADGGTGTAGTESAAGTDDGIGETGTEGAAGTGEATGTAGTGDGTGEAGGETGTGDGTGAAGTDGGAGMDDGTGTVNTGDGTGEVGGETGAGGETGDGEGTNSATGGESLFDEALAALEGEGAGEAGGEGGDEGSGSSSETWQIPEDDAEDITFINSAEQPKTPVISEKNDGTEKTEPAEDEQGGDSDKTKPAEDEQGGDSDKTESVEDEQGGDSDKTVLAEDEQGGTPDENADSEEQLNNNNEETPSNPESDQDHESDIPELAEVGGEDLSISAYSAEEAEAMALMLGLKPRMQLKKGGLKKNSALRMTAQDAEPQAESDSEATPEAAPESAPEAVPETAIETGFAAFDISLKEDADIASAEGYLVHVNLSEPVVLPQKENMEITGVTYELYHIPEGSNIPALVEAEFHDSREEGLLYGFTFETDGFSDYLLKYTVDFVFVGTKEEEPEEEPAEKTYGYVFQGLEDTQLLSYILGVNELYLTVRNAAVDDEEAVALDEDLYLTPLKYFALVTLTVEDEEENLYTILLSNPAPEIPSYSYEFTDEKNSVLLSEILGEDYAIVSAAAEDETLLSVEPAEDDYQVTALARFGEAIVTAETALGEKIEIIFRNPDPEGPIDVPEESVIIAEADVTEAAAALGIEEATAEQTLTDEEGKEYILYTKTGFFGLDLDIDESLKTEDGLYSVTVTLAEPFQLVTDEYAQIQRTELKLWHVDGEPAEMTDAAFREEDGVLYGFTFTADSFSPYLVSYTIDFIVADPEIGGMTAWSWPGRGSYAIREILEQVGVTGEISKVTLEKIIDKGGAENALYLEEKEDGWYLTSEVPFEDTFELDVTVDHTVYMFYITDAAGDTFLTIKFVDEDGNSLAGNAISDYYYVQIRLAVRGMGMGPGPGATSNYYLQRQITSLDNIEIKGNENFVPSRGWGSITYDMWSYLLSGDPVVSAVINRDGASSPIPSWDINHRKDATTIGDYRIVSITEDSGSTDGNYQWTITLHVPQRLELDVNYYGYDGATDYNASVGNYPADDLPDGNYVAIVAYSGDSWSNIKNWDPKTPIWVESIPSDVFISDASYQTHISKLITDKNDANRTITYEELAGRPDFDESKIKVRYINVGNNNPKTLGDLQNIGDIVNMLNGGIDGFDFQNTTGYKGSDRYEVNIEKAYEKTFEVVLDYTDVSDPSSFSLPDDTYYVRLEATTSSGAKVYSTVPISTTDGHTFTISGFSNDATYTVTTEVVEENGKKLVKLKLPMEAWTSGQRYSDNWRSITASIVKPLGKDLSDVRNMTADKAYTYAYNLVDYTYSDQGLNKEYYEDSTNHVREIAYVYKITDAIFESAIGPDNILGEAAEFGIVANEYIQEGHTETNFAVNYLNDNSNIDIDGSGDGAMPFYAGSITGRLWISQGTKVPVDVFVTPEDIDAGKLNMTARNYEIIPTDQSVINSYVNGLISAGQAKSAQLAGKVTVRPTKLSDLKTVDLRDFPDNITVYVDCSLIKENIIENDGWTLQKWENQYVVFNVPGEDVEIHEFFVDTYNINDPNTRTHHVQSTTAALDGDPARNQEVDEIIFDHVCFNMPEATNVHLHNASALFLCPQAEMVTQDNGAGWILAKGTVHSKSEWHFYRHTRNYTAASESSQIKLTKKLTDKNGNAIDYVDLGYTFTLTQVSATYNSEGDDDDVISWNTPITDQAGTIYHDTTKYKDYPLTASASAAGQVSFPLPKFTNYEIAEDGLSEGKSKAFYAVIRENLPASDGTEPSLGYYQNGVLYSADEIRLKIVAHDKEDQKNDITVTVYAWDTANSSWKSLQDYKWDSEKNQWVENSTTKNSFEYGDFTNQAAAGEAELKGGKTILNGALTQDDVDTFSFNLTAVTKDAPMPVKTITTTEGEGDHAVETTTTEKVTALQMESVDDPWFYFTKEKNNIAIPFTLSDLNRDADGNPVETTFEYLITESGDRTEAGITNDEREHTVKIAVRTATSEEVSVGTYEASQLVTSVTYYIDGEEVQEAEFLFSNTSKTNYRLMGGKELTGRDIQAGEFRFVATEDYNAAGEPINEDSTDQDVASTQTVATGTNRAATATLETVGEGAEAEQVYLAKAAIEFTPIVYEEEGKHVYTVKEYDDGVTGMTYDTAVYRVYVTVAGVTDPESPDYGKMVAEVTKIEKGVIAEGETTPTFTKVTLNDPLNLEDLVVFENDYKVKTTLDATKQMDGVQGTRNYFKTGDEWSFTLKGECLTDSSRTAPLPDGGEKKNETYSNDGGITQLPVVEVGENSVVYHLYFDEDKPEPNYNEQGEADPTSVYIENFGFGEIEFDKGDVGHIYRYTIEESGTVAGVQNDGNKYVDLQITQSSDGTINIIRLTDQNPTAFINYAAEQTSVEVIKDWGAAQLTAGEAEVEMTLIAVRSAGVTVITRDKYIPLTLEFDTDNYPANVTMTATATSSEDPTETYTVSWVPNAKSTTVNLGATQGQGGSVVGLMKQSTTYNVYVTMNDPNGNTRIISINPTGSYTDNTANVNVTSGNGVTVRAHYTDGIDVTVNWNAAPTGVTVTATLTNEQDSSDTKTITLTNSGTTSTGRFIGLKGDTTYSVEIQLDINSIPEGNSVSITSTNPRTGIQNGDASSAVFGASYRGGDTTTVTVNISKFLNGQYYSGQKPGKETETPTINARILIKLLTTNYDVVASTHIDLPNGRTATVSYDGDYHPDEWNSVPITLVRIEFEQAPDNGYIVYNNAVINNALQIESKDVNTINLDIWYYDANTYDSLSSRYRLEGYKSLIKTQREHIINPEWLIAKAITASDVVFVSPLDENSRETAFEDIGVDQGLKSAQAQINEGSGGVDVVINKGGYIVLDRVILDGGSGRNDDTSADPWHYTWDNLPKAIREGDVEYTLTYYVIETSSNYSNNL